jgi:hypothetical protein
VQALPLHTRTVGERDSCPSADCAAQPAKPKTVTNNKGTEKRIATHPEHIYFFCNTSNT